MASQMPYMSTAAFGQYPGATMYPKAVSKLGPGHGSVDELSQAFAGLNPVHYNMMPNAMSSNGYVPLGAQNTAAGPNMLCFKTPDGRTFYQAASHGQTFQQGPPGYPSSATGQFHQPFGYRQIISATPQPMGMGWSGAPNGGHEVPELARRNSLSSVEENGPQTPFFGGVQAPFDYKTRIAMAENSPQTWSTPSPHQLCVPFVPQQLMKRSGQYVQVDLDSICKQEPAIPLPVPAIFSSEKSRGTLDKCLKNDTNTTNVYIRGLHPNTTDEMLLKYGERFGDIASAKSMLDQANNLCKGFGFIKYENFDDGENCIRGFFHLGYEAKWARVSHNERLKTLGDDNNTNLYVSNLPLNFNENMLMSVFHEHEVLSAKILRDENGMSRGVGFARFASPEICMSVINMYNGAPVGEDRNQLSIRFADTPDQKKLKNLTAERRQFKTNEYNTAAYGPGSPYASPTTATFPSPVLARPPMSHAVWSVQPSPNTLYNAYNPLAYQIGPAHSAAVPIRLPGAEGGIPSIHRTPVVGGFDSPSVTAHAKRVSISQNLLASQIQIEPGLEDVALRSITGNVIRTDVAISPSKSTKEASLKASPSKTTGLGIRTSPTKSTSSRF